MNKPAFDPSQPFQSSDNEKPAFDPSQPFSSADQSSSEGQTQGQSSNATLESVAQPIRDIGNAIAPYAQQALSSPDIQPFKNGANPFMQPQGSPVQQVLGSMRQVASLPLRYSATLGQASGPVSDYVATKLGSSGTNPYLSAAAGMVAGAASDPRSYIPIGGISTNQPDELPLNVAQAREARTGVPARQFQQLYKDPGAIFAGKNIAQAGSDIGVAKEAAGINPGVTNDVSSLTPENVERINPTKAMKMDDINLVLSKLNQPDANNLPVVNVSNPKAGSPYALFQGNFEGTSQSPAFSTFRLYGDHPRSGGNFSVDDLNKMGIPVTGREARVPPNVQPIGLQSAKVTPQEAQNALDSVNSILAQPSVQNNRDVFRQWSSIKTHLNNVLGDVAPNVRQANAAYAREKLGQAFSSMNPVNKTGTPSKLAMLAQQVPGGIGAAIGGSIAGPGGAAAGYEVGKGFNSLYHAPYLAGLQTAAGSVANKAIKPLLQGTEKGITSPAMQAYLARYVQQNTNR